MSFRGSARRARAWLLTLRAKAWLLVIALTALWAFSAWVTVRDGLNLAWVQTLNSKVYEPSEPLMVDLQAERRASLIYLAGPGARAALDESRQRTDVAATAFRRDARSWLASTASSAETRQRIGDVMAGLNGLPTTRASIDARVIDRTEAQAAITAMIDPIWHLYESLATLDDQQIARTGTDLIELDRAWELVSQEDAVVAGVLTAGQMTGAEHAQLVQLVDVNRFQADQAAGKLPEADRARYDEAAGGAAMIRLRGLEDLMVGSDQAGAPLRVTIAEWRDAAVPAMDAIHRVVVTGGDDLVDRATPVVLGVLLRLIGATGLGLLTVIVAITTVRRVVREMDGLRVTALDLAHTQLPGIVERLRRGEDVDVAAEAPPPVAGRRDNTEIGQVRDAFAAVQQTAVGTAVQQADLRRNFRELILSISRRSQALIHRQLNTLVEMERQEDDPGKLEPMFLVDHLATRMRRHAENLLVLAGSSAGRAWRRDVPMIDVVRAAAQEVEDFARVSESPMGPVGLVGRAVGDVIHLLAELIENALFSSPPNTIVEVRGQTVANGYAIEVEDRGFGMTAEARAAANAQIADRQEFRPATNARLGLFVVSSLAGRHGVRIHLKESPYGGTTAVVLIPQDLVARVESGADETGTQGTGTEGTRVEGTRVDETGVDEAGATATGATSSGGRQPIAGVAGLGARRLLPDAEPMLALDPPAAGYVDAEPAPSALTEASEPTASGYAAGEPAPTGYAANASAPGGYAASGPPPGGYAAGGQRWADEPTGPIPTMADGPQRGPHVGSQRGPQVGSQPGPQVGSMPGPQSTAGPGSLWTESGLPVRTRRATPPARQPRPTPSPTPRPSGTQQWLREPEEVSRRMSAYQSGTRRARIETARMSDPDADPTSQSS